MLAAAQFDAFSGREPEDLGVHQGRLKAPSLTPNSVSSQAKLYPEHPQRVYAAIEPLALLPGHSGAESLLQLNKILAEQPGVKVTHMDADYLRAQARTRWMGFVDDLEFWFNPQPQVIEVRSASRLGRKDFGMNRERVERIRNAYSHSPGTKVVAPQ